MSTSLDEFLNDEIDLHDNFLINYGFVPNGLVSGLSTNYLNELTKETASKTSEQQSVEYPTIPNAIEYPQLDPGITNELDQAEISMRPKSSVSPTSNMRRSSRILCRVTTIRTISRPGQRMFYLIISAISTTV